MSKKSAEAVMHITGAPGSGKTTLLNDMKPMFPGFEFKDQDDFTEDVLAEMGLPDPDTFKNWPDFWDSITPEQEKQYDELMATAHKRFVEKHKKPVVFGGMNYLNPVIEKLNKNRLYKLDTWPIVAAWRSYLRARNRPSEWGDDMGLLDIPSAWMQNRRFDRDFDNHGYKESSRDQIIAALKRIRSKRIKSSSYKLGYQMCKQATSVPLIDPPDRTREPSMPIVEPPPVPPDTLTGDIGNFAKNRYPDAYADYKGMLDRLSGNRPIIAPNERPVLQNTYNKVAPPIRDYVNNYGISNTLKTVLPSVIEGRYPAVHSDIQTGKEELTNLQPTLANAADAKYPGMGGDINSILDSIKNDDFIGAGATAYTSRNKYPEFNKDINTIKDYYKKYGDKISLTGVGEVLTERYPEIKANIKEIYDMVSNNESAKGVVEEYKVTRADLDLMLQNLTKTKRSPEDIANAIANVKWLIEKNDAGYSPFLDAINKLTGISPAKQIFRPWRDDFKQGIKNYAIENTEDLFDPKMPESWSGLGGLGEVTALRDPLLAGIGAGSAYGSGKAGLGLMKGLKSGMPASGSGNALGQLWLASLLKNLMVNLGVDPGLEVLRPSSKPINEATDEEFEKEVERNKRQTDWWGNSGSMIGPGPGYSRENLERMRRGQGPIY